MINARPAREPACFAGRNGFLTNAGKVNIKGENFCEHCSRPWSSAPLDIGEYFCELSAFLQHARARKQMRGRAMVSFSVNGCGPAWLRGVLLLR